MAKLDKLAGTATKLVKRFGRNAIYIRAVGGGEQVYNEETGLFETVDSSVSLAIKITPPKSPTPDELEDGQVVESDLTFIIDAATLGFDPKPNDTVQIKDVLHTVITSRRVDSGELTAYYRLVVRS